METPKTDVLSDIVLPVETTALANRLRAWIVLADIKAEKNEARKKVKQEWAKRWAELFLPDVTLDFSNDPWFAFKDTLDECEAIETKLQAGVLLVELVSFTPYIPLASDAPDADAEKEFLKSLKKVKLDNVVRHEVLDNPAIAMGFDKDYPEAIEKMLGKALHSLQGGWMKTIAYATGGAVILAIAGAVSATGIGAAIGAAMGLQGAAAIAAGLAFLGGGSLASGGLGMAGGFAVIVATGSAVGAGAGFGTRNVVEHLTKAAALNESAKMRVVLDEIVRKHHGDVQIHQEVLRRQRGLIADLQHQIDEHCLEIARLQAQDSKNRDRAKELKDRVVELEEIIGVIETSAKMGRETFVQHALES